MKKVIMVLLAMCISSLAFAQFHIIPDENDSIGQWFQASYGRSTNKGFEQKQNFWSVSYQFDYNPFDAFIGFQYTDDVTDMMLDTDWWLAQFDGHFGRMRLGVNLGYHAEWYNEISCEHDFTFVPAELNYRTWENFWVMLRTGLTRKISDVYLIKNTVENWNILLTLSLGKIWSNGLELSLDVGTRSVYRHPLFGTALFTFGAAYHFKNGFRIGAETEITMRDWIAATYYMDSVVIRLTGRVSF
ncbi:MAG: hypothetical protein IJP62_11495 [Treponema sp.]|nr:hypothetical protein [Treponema sp.]